MWRPILRTLVVVALILLIGLGIAQDQEVLHVESAYAASDPDFPVYVAALTGTALTSSNRYQVLVNGNQVYPSMLDAIERARRRISFETYIYSAGDMADRFTRALEAAARRGVRCNLVFDALGSKDLPDDHVRRLRDAGCVIGIFNTPAWYALEEFNYRTHRKILTIDGAVGFVGGIGIADYWSGDAEDADHWRDTQIRIEGPAVRYLEAAFYENFSETTRPVTPRFELPPEFPPTGSERALALWSSPTGGGSTMKLLFLLSISGARRTLDICSPYFLTDESTMWAIERAVDRGVRVRILVEGDITDAKPVKFSSRAAYEHLLERGIQIYEYRPTMMHAKTMVADGIWSIVGSANFDNRSFELNDELNVGVYDASLATRLADDFERDLRRSTRLELETWRSRPRLEQIREKFWSMFGEVF